MTAINTAQTTWSLVLPAHMTPTANAMSALAKEDAARVTLELHFRPLVRRLQASLSVCDAKRVSLGITIPDPAGSHARRRRRGR